MNIARVLFFTTIGLLITEPVAAQQLNIDFGDDEVFTGRMFQIIALVTVISLAPSLLIVTTSFTRIIIVLSLMRSAIGVQQAPPNTVLVGLALFLTAFVMAPTFQQAYQDGIAPLINQEISEEEAFTRTVRPVHSFMMGMVRQKDLSLFLDLARVEQPETPEDTPLSPHYPDDHVI